MYKEGQKVVVIRDTPQEAELYKGDVVTLAYVECNEGYEGDPYYEFETTDGWYLTEEDVEPYRKPVYLPEELFHVG
jgi:hypothetical protein